MSPDSRPKVRSGSKERTVLLQHHPMDQEKQTSHFPRIVLLFLLATSACVGAEITDERTIQSANRAFVGEERLPPEWTFYLGKV